MKSPLCLGLLFILMATVLSCGPKEDTQKYKIGFSQCVSNDAWRKAMHDEMYRELSFYPDMSLEIKDAQGDNTTQIHQIKDLVESGIDLLIVSPNESSPITPIVEEVFQNGIPVIVVDRKTSSNLYSAYVGGNNYEVGFTAGQYIRNLLNGKGKILEIWGLRGSSPAVERHRGLLNAFQGSEIDIVAEVNGQWEKDTAKSRLSEHLLKENIAEFDLIFGHNDVMAIGAREICNSLNIENKKFLGVDALPGPYGGIQAVTDKVLNATFFYPTGGDKAIEVAHNILTGENFEKENILQTAVVDSSNVRIIKQQTDKIIDQQDNITRQKDRINIQMEIYKNQRTFLFGFGLTLLIAIISLVYVFKSLREKQEINKELKNKNREISEQKDKVLELSQKAEIATQHKFEFFTNISHEFRTPLTLIQAPVEDLLNNKDAAPFKNDLSLIRKNSMRLLRLVNQLMDLRKLDSAKMQVKAAEHDIIPFLEEIMSSFRKLANQRGITFKLLAEDRNIKLWFDPMMLDKVMFNLLSNAFKFTHEKGSIIIKVEQTSLLNEVIIKVEDSGDGMSEETVKHIFDRFYQGEHFTQSGSGLGLALSKELIELHHGHIEAESQLGQGAKFSIHLVKGKSHFQPSEIIEGDHPQFFSEENISYEDIDTASVPLEGNVPKEHTILVIEDEKPIREYLGKQLGQYFNIIQAENLETGLGKALDQVPDLITIDLMLQQKDGLDIIRTLKNDIRTSHIPIIVITAKKGIEERIKGIKLGIDDYITKPFSTTLVLERIKMLLANRQKLKEHYIHKLPVETSIPTNQTPDKKFINNFTAVVEKNISNSQFGVNEICEELGLSRGQLYRKAKALLGYSVNDYINKVRLKKAKHLLVAENLPIADIAFQVGFTTSAYFSTAFKNHFGITPSEFREQQQEI